jgi:transposase InsO family protein
MKPLYFLTSEKNKFEWNIEHEEIRRKIIHILTNNPVLIIFDPQYPIELHTDASAIGYGAILLHRIENKPYVVEYYSKTTSLCKSKYTLYDLETLAVVNAVKHFRHYLHGRKFVIFTDCNSLKSSRNKIELMPRVYRWWAYLQSFDFDIQYREGKRMAHADFFSRNPLPPKNSPEYAKIVEKRIELTEISEDWIRAEQQKDQDIVEITSKLSNDEFPLELPKTYDLRAGVLYRIIQRNSKTLCLPVVPRGFRWSVINQVHESIMHLGWEKTLDKVYDYYWFDGMAKYVRRFVENCITCRVSKSSSGKIQMELHPIPKVSIPWHTIHIDITGKLSGKSDRKEYVIVQIDAFTKYIYLYHTYSLSAETCVMALKSSISLFGVPIRILADQGRSFTGAKFVEFCSSQKIKLHLIATGTSRGNGQVERAMSTLKNLLTAVEASSRSWQEALGDVQLAINCTVNKTTKASPLELLMGKVARPLGLVPIHDAEAEIDLTKIRTQALENIEKSGKYEKERFDKSRAKIVKFSVGDFVLLNNSERNQTKLDAKYRGPFEITEVLENDRYTLKSMKSNRRYKYAHERLRRLPDGQVPSELEIDVSPPDETVERDSSETVEIDSSEAVERDSSEAVEIDSIGSC